MSFRIFPATEFDATSTRAFRSANCKALCIGINAYSSRPLDCCVADAMAWKSYFNSQGFETRTLIDQQATKRAILEAIRNLVTSADPGDVIAVQYSGHGTQLNRASGDESTDEALVPIDFQGGNYVVDDDLGAINDLIPDGVNVTYFMDCCHSGTNTRSLFGMDLADLPPGVNVRYMPPEAGAQAAFLQADRGRTFSRSTPYEGRREVLFSACEPAQLSFESRSSGHGFFTLNALKVLKRGAAQMSNEAFIQSVRAQFSDTSRQRPALWSDDSLWQATFLSPRTGGGLAPSNPQTVDSGEGGLSLLDRLKRLEMTMGL